MLLHVVHETVYDYSPPVRTAQHMAHLRPSARDGQKLLRHKLEISPEPAQHSESMDVFGNTRSFFGLQATHDSLRVVADSVVATVPHDVPDTSLSWEEARERLRYHRGAEYDPAAEFAFGSPYVPRHADFANYARASFVAGRPLIDAARDLTSRVHEDFEYVSQATDASTPALEALELRRGVCQDFAHVMLGCLRSLGLPARYVSGYLLTEPPPGRPRLVGSDASHAWVSVYLPSQTGRGRWADLDPTNDRAAGEDYVTLAVGRDYADVSPIRGVIHGGAQHTLEVAVTVTPLDAQAAGAFPTIADPIPKDSR
ncbi:transglutaminase family protein [Ramlibacter sp. Leaf400]|uniref:transglutaminase family protein n=1 Tax=Ramlibacter sp. Leaf400 TaxID=1736365 RepID=UPI0006FFBDA6|nr:transglutaminase family protein [Ramlibacter sp. Leaf400]KQT11137.1 transglutaminase [Ramlibacter sp. Leaf400]